MAGMQLFGAQNFPQNDEGVEVMQGSARRFNFDSIFNSYISVFAMIMGSSTLGIIRDLAGGLGMHVFLFPILWRLLAKHFILATIAASLMHQVEADALDYMRGSCRSVLQSCFLLEQSMMRAWVAIYFSKWRDMMYLAGGRRLPGRLLEIRSEDVQQPKKGCCSSPKSYGVFEESGYIRSTCKRISSALWFDVLTILMILLGCAGLSFDAEQRAGHRNKRHRPDSETVTIIEGFVVHFFVAEFFIRTIADGEFAYLCASRLNFLDAFSTWCSTLSYYNVFSAIQAIGGVSDELALMKILRMVRVVRPLRLLNRSESLRNVLTAFGESMQAVKNILGIIFLLMFIFSLIGMQLFGGLFSRCTDPAFPAGAAKDAVSAEFPTGCAGAFISESGQAEAREWATTPYNFDSIASAMMSSFVVFTFDERWEAILFSAIDVTDEGVQPKHNNSRANALLFILFVLVSYCALQLLVSSVYGAFMYLTGATLSLHPPIHPATHPPIHLPNPPSIHPSTHPPAHARTSDQGWPQTVVYEGEHLEKNRLYNSCSPSPSPLAPALASRPRPHAPPSHPRLRLTVSALPLPSKDAFWFIYEAKLRCVEPLDETAPPRPGTCRRVLYTLTRSNVYGRSVILTTCATAVYSATTSMVFPEGAHEEASRGVSPTQVDFLVSALFLGEWVVRAFGTGLRGMTMAWYRRFDIVLTAFMFSAFTLELMTGDEDGSLLEVKLVRLRTSRDVSKSEVNRRQPQLQPSHNLDHHHRRPGCRLPKADELAPSVPAYSHHPVRAERAYLIGRVREKHRLSNSADHGIRSDHVHMGSARRHNFW